MEADSTRFGAQQESRYTIPLIALAFSFSLILLSWLLFNWLDYDTVAVMLLPLLALLTLLSGLLTVLLRWLGLRPWRIETNGQGVYRYITVVAILIASAPACSYLYGIWITTSFVSAFDLNVRLESREFLLLEPGHPYGEYTPFRGITTVYTLLDPIAATKAKLRDRLHDQPGWLLSRTEYFWGSCDRNRLGRYMTVILAGNDTLQVAVQYGAPSYCFLN